MRVIVCGAGQVGTTIARHLASEGISVTVIDTDEQLVRRIDESYDVRGITGHASYPATLQKADARDADMLIAVTRSDEVNMVACQVAYSLFGVKQRIARIRHAGYFTHDSSALYAEDHLPIDIVISPEIEIADGIAWRLRAPGAFDMVPMAGGLVELLGIHVEAAESQVMNQRIADIEQLPELEGVSIVACRRKGRSFVPVANDRIEQGDEVYVIAQAKRSTAVMSAFGHREREAKNLIIVGGGNVGLHLVETLKASASKVNIKIIEQDRARALSLADQFGSGVIVLHGDALDQVVLEEAHANLAHTIVAVSNDDETNIFASVLAKQMGCQRAITLINKRSYEALTPTLGIDAVVSPSAATISTVLRYVRRGDIVALHTLREDFGEVVEAEITEESRLYAKPLGQLDLPPGMKIGAYIRDGQALVPQPETQLEIGDHIVALVSYSSLELTEALLGKRRGRLG